MDYKELIKRLKNAAGGPEGIAMCHDAATAITELLERAEKAEIELDAAVNDLNEILSLDEMCPLQCKWCAWNDDCGGTKPPKWSGVKED